MGLAYRRWKEGPCSKVILKWQVRAGIRAGAVGINAPTGPLRGLFLPPPRPRPWPFLPPSVARSAPVRGPFRLRPWPARPPQSGAHGRIADGGGPDSRLEARTRWSAGGDSGRAYGL